MEASRLNPKDAYIVIETAFCDAESEPAASAALCARPRFRKTDRSSGESGSARTSP
jgi:hypothetical protein